MKNNAHTEATIEKHGQRQKRWEYKPRNCRLSQKVGEGQVHTLLFLMLSCLLDFIAIALAMLCPSYKGHHIPILCPVRGLGDGNKYGMLGN